jgi:XisI protein
MDRVARYREIIRRTLAEYARGRFAAGDIRSEVIVDPDHDHFQLINVGWDGDLRIHGTVLHLDIIDGKVWVQHDGTDGPVAEALEAAGVSKDDIVLAWHPPYLRELTGYAVG